MTNPRKQLLHRLPYAKRSRNDITGYRLRTANRWALPLGLVGLAAVALHNWRLWQKDKALLAAQGAPPPRPPLAEWPALPLVSVLVAAWNEAVHIERHIESFLALRYPHKELVLCAGGTDETYALAQRYTGETVTLLEQQPGEGKQRALARSLPHARGEIIFLTDADCLLDDDAFERTLYPVAVGEEQVCTGGSKPLSEQANNPFVTSQLVNQLYGSLHAPTYASGVLGRNCAIKYGLLKESKGFLTPAPTGTDYVLAKRLIQSGARIRYLAESQVLTHYPMTFSDYTWQQTRWLKNHLLWGSHFYDWVHVRHAVVTALIGWVMIVSPLMALLLGKVGTVCLSLVWLSVLLSRVRYRAFSTRLIDFSTKPKAYHLAATMLADFFAWSRVLVDIWHRKGRKQW